MKKVIIYIISIIIILFIADFFLGICSRYYIKNHQLTGRYKPLDRLIKEVDTDIVLIGNSAILNSLDPQILEDSLSMTCYNGGIIGQGIEFSETIIDCILQRHTPQMIILGLRPEEMGGNIGEGIYDVLKPYYKMGYTSIDNHFNHTEGIERILINSNLIRFNTIWVRVLLYMLFDNTIYQDNGFMPMEVPQALPIKKIMNGFEEPVKEKLNCIERIIRKCNAKKIKIVICFPPTLIIFNQNTLPCVNTVYDLCKENNVPCFIDYNNYYFLNHPELFYDNGHVNKNGANQYSHLIAKKIKQIYYKKRENI